MTSSDQTTSEALGVARDPWSLVVVALAAAVMVTSQVIRLDQVSPELWLAADYAGRLLSLAILFGFRTRVIAFAHEKLSIRLTEASVWILSLVIIYLLALEPLRVAIGSLIPGTRLGWLPEIHGALLVVDATIGLTLVAVHEEVVFRRLARGLLRPVVGDGLPMIAVSATLFGLYHWHTGIGNVVSAALFGALAMLVYKRSATIVPVVIAHYLIDAFLLIPAAGV